MGIQKAKDIARQKEIEKEMQQAAIARDIARSNKAIAGTGGYQAGYDQWFYGRTTWCRLWYGCSRSKVALIRWAHLKIKWSYGLWWKKWNS